MPMSIHYSGQQALASGMVKQRVLEDFLAVVAAVPAAQEIISGKPDLISEDTLTWEIVASKHQDLKRAREAGVIPSEGGRESKVKKERKKAK